MLRKVYVDYIALWMGDEFMDDKKLKRYRIFKRILKMHRILNICYKI